MSWLRVTRNKPCPVCGKPDWCCYTQEGYVLCMRSDGYAQGWDMVKYVPSNGGHVFRSTGHIPKSNSFEPRKKQEPTIEWKPIVDSFDIGKSNRPGAGAWLSEQLGIPVVFLEMFGLGWSEGHRAFTFPMYDHERNITGVRLRYISGEKKSIRGSKDGVFLPYFDFVDPILVTEGPTDASALTVLGFTTVGRPSCLGGTEIIAKIAHNRDVVIVSDRDEPGRRGAVALASRLVPISKGIKIIEPVGEANDAREWVNKGATNEVIQMVIDSAVDYRKTAQRDVVKNRS